MRTVSTDSFRIEDNTQDISMMGIVKSNINVIVYNVTFSLITNFNMNRPIPVQSHTIRE